MSEVQWSVLQVDHGKVDQYCSTQPESHTHIEVAPLLVCLDEDGRGTGEGGGGKGRR